VLWTADDDKHDGASLWQASHNHRQPALQRMLLQPLLTRHHPETISDVLSMTIMTCHVVLSAALKHLRHQCLGNYPRSPKAL
jgi:hypothetical protein